MFHPRDREAAVEGAAGALGDDACPDAVGHIGEALVGSKRARGGASECDGERGGGGG